MSGNLERTVMRLSRIAATGMRRAVASGMSPEDALRLAAMATAAALVNAAFSVARGTDIELASPAVTTEFKSAFLQFLRLARSKDPRDEASQPAPTKH